MASSEGYGFRMPFVSFRRPILTVKDYQFHSQLNHDPSGITSLDSFQRLVSARFHELSLVKSDEFLSSFWICKLLDSLTKCLEEFEAVLRDNKHLLSKPPADKLAFEFFERAVKAMDIFNATRDGVSNIRAWMKHLEIVQTALDTEQKIVGEGQFRRARKALTDLALLMICNDKENSNKSIFSQRNRSFVRTRKDHQSRSPVHKHTRSLSWSVSLTWSASKQLQSITNNLVPPRTNEIAGTSGIVVLIFTMSFILAFVSWALVALIPCQDRIRDQVNILIPRHFSWSTPVFLIHSRILDESKKRDRRNSNGLLKEIFKIEKCVHQITDLIDSPTCHFPLSEELKEELRSNVQQLGSVSDACKNGLDPLERGLRDVFKKIMSCRNHGLALLGKAT